MSYKLVIPISYHFKNVGADCILTLPLPREEGVKR